MIIDSCMRPESRTRRILDAAKEVLSSRYDIESIDVNEAALPPLTPKSLAERSSGIVPEATVALARKIAAADRIIIAAPFWDMSFPAALKAFFTVSPSKRLFYIYYIKLVARPAELLLPGRVETEHTVRREKLALDNARFV